jgi:predicted Holliday junction resolvase-like endonuclease
MTMILGLVTTLSMLTLGFVLGRIWEIRRAMLSNQRRAEDELTRQRLAEDELIRQQAANRLSSARRWA